MKIIALGKAKNELSTYVDRAQEERVLITKHGKPAALMVGVEGKDLEDIVLQANPEFWRMIESRRRRGKTISLRRLRGRKAIAPRGKH